MTTRQKTHPRPRLTAGSADKYVLYQDAVQSPDFDVRFIPRIFRKYNRRTPLSLCEDFCGTALVCTEWVKSHPKRTATGMDLNRRVLAWGELHNVQPLGTAARRVRLLNQDVRSPRRGRKFDVIVAQNYSYFVFKTRPGMLAYFKAVRRCLKPDGLFFIDTYSGWDSHIPGRCVREETGYTYIWDQHLYNAVDGRVVNYIHFKFPDGTKLWRAFRYDWRLWSVIELKELLLEAGFSAVDVYFEDIDKKGDGLGTFRVRKRAQNAAAWNAYLVGKKHK